MFARMVTFHFKGLPIWHQVQRYIHYQPIQNNIKQSWEAMMSPKCVAFLNCFIEWLQCIVCWSHPWFTAKNLPVCEFISIVPLFIKVSGEIWNTCPPPWHRLYIAFIKVNFTRRAMKVISTYICVMIYTINPGFYLYLTSPLHVLDRINCPIQLNLL